MCCADVGELDPQGNPTGAGLALHGPNGYQHVGQQLSIPGHAVVRSCQNSGSYQGGEARSLRWVGAQLNASLYDSCAVCSGSCLLVQVSNKRSRLRWRSGAACRVVLIEGRLAGWDDYD